MFDKIKIRSGIPIPPPSKSARSHLSVIANKMQTGDSVDVPKSQAVGMCQTIRRMHEGATMRKLDDNTWRIWRTK
jgi:hypothetical protein